MSERGYNAANNYNINSPEAYPYLPLPSVNDDPILKKKFYIVNDTSSRDSTVIPVIFAITYYLIGVILPLYNNVLFRGYNRFSLEGGFHYPLTATWLTMLGTVVVLFIYNLIMHQMQRNDVLQKSWIGGTHFLWKCGQLLIVSLAFAAVMALTNVGLFLIKDVNVHVLLRCSEIIWVVLFAFLIQKEIPSIWTVFCCLALIGGTIMVSLDFSKAFRSPPVLAILLNLGSSVASGLMTVLLRRACLIMKEKDPTISILEITLIKMGLASIFLAPFVFIFERPAWDVLFYHEDVEVKLLVGAGVILTMLYQTTVVGLAAYSLAITVGIVSQSKIIPQIILSIVWTHKFSPSFLHIGGTVLVVLGTMAYAAIRWRKHNTQLYEKEMKTQNEMLE